MKPIFYKKITKIPILTTEMSAVRIMTVNFIHFFIKMTNTVPKIGHVH